MVDAFVDSNILIDILRQYPPALNWYASQSSVLGITPITTLELLRGARRKQDYITIHTLLAAFPTVYQNHADFNWAIHQFERHWLSHRSSINDCLIASVAHRLNVPLYTHNVKHITPVLSSLAQAPY